MSIRIGFLGAAQTVTGSRFLVESDRSRVLVDAGMFQGDRALRQRNWEPFPVPPDTIDTVVVTHAHLDHSGYLPVLVREGFRGPVHCTPQTAALMTVVDLRGYSAHADAEQVLTWLSTAPEPRTVFVVHGEPSAAAAFACSVHRRLGWNAVVPHHREKVRID